MARTNASAGAKNDTKSVKKAKILSVAEIERLYPNEYVIMEITRDAKREESIRGRIIDHGPEEEADAIVRRNLDFFRENPEVYTYQFHTRRTIPDDVIIVI